MPSSHRKHRYQRLAPRSNTEYLARPRALFSAIALKSSPRLSGFTVTTLSLGKIIILALYASSTLFLLASVDAPVLSSHFLDDIAFRAAWVTLSQTPLVYLLSARRGPLNFVIGLSHERLNWLHRWVGRILLLSATVHVAIMKSSISTKDILRSHEEGMTVVRYGVATYAMLLWIAVSSILPLRRWNYRIFYINHYVSTLIFLAIAFQHVPSYARPPIYLAATILLLDKFLIAYFFLSNNISITTSPNRFRRARTFKLGYPIRMTTPPTSFALPSTTILTMPHIPFPWRPGQHIRLSIPSLHLISSHPFTPANASSLPPPPLPPRKDIDIEHLSRRQPRQTSTLLLLIQPKTGFTRCLANHYTSWLSAPCPNASTPAEQHLTAYIDGPYGAPPKWEEYEELVLISAGTGVSFSLAVLEYLAQLVFAGEQIRARRVVWVWVRRHVDAGLEGVVRERVKGCVEMLREGGVGVDGGVWTTCRDSRGDEVKEVDLFAHLRPSIMRRPSVKPDLKIRHPDEIYEEWEREAEEMFAHDDPQPFNLQDQDEDSGSEAGTLVDGPGSDDWTVNLEDDDDPFSDHHATHDDMYRPLPPLPPPSAQQAVRKEGCDCAMIQHQRRKSQTKDRSYMQERFGERLDIKEMLKMMDLGRSGKCMVAVCANASVTRDVRDVVSALEMDFAMGTGRARRTGRVEVWIEGEG